jgi:hypothetical protein
MYTGPNLTKNGLVFGYDSGYGVANNNTATRFYPGEPTTNKIPLTDFISTSNWTGGGWQGSLAVSSDYDNTLEFTAYNGWRTFAINHGFTSGGTVSVSFEYKLKSAETSNIYGLVLNGRNLGNYHNNLGNISNSNLNSRVWKKYNGTFTANNNTYGAELAIGLRGADNAGENNVMYVRNLQVEQKGHSTPYTPTSRSNTQGLIDLKRTVSIDLSDVSFDSTGQPDFDGSNDNINFGNIAALQNLSTGTIEIVYHRDASTGTYQMIFTDAISDFEVTYSGNTLQFYIGNSGISYAHSVTGEFFHLVGIWGIGYKKLYLNGSLVASGTNTGVDTGSRTRYVGGRGTSFPFNGKIPVTKVYSKALTTEEISNNFKAYKNRFNI